jgi:hypothetical protein
MKKIDSKKNRQEKVIDLIIRQTNYNKEEAAEKLTKWGGNYLNVMKEYMNPDFNIKKNVESKKSLNQQIMTEIRNFCNNKITKN